MLIAEDALFHLLTEYSEEVDKLGASRPLTREIDIIAFAALHLTAEYESQFRYSSELLKAVHKCRERIRGERDGKVVVESLSKQPEDWLLIDELAFILVTILLKKEDTNDIFTFLPYYLLEHSQSSIRGHSFNVFWFYRKHADREQLLKHLLKNMADTLGYVPHTVGLARSMFDSDEAFFNAADDFEPPERFEDQYLSRLEKIKEEGVLIQYQRMFLPIELKTREKIEQYALIQEINPM